MSSADSKKSMPILLGLLGGWALGLLCHLFFPESAMVGWMASHVAVPLGQIFLRMIFMIVVPLVFTALVLAVVELGDPRKLGRLGLRTLGFTLLITGMAVIIGLVLVHVIGPGRGIDAENRARLLQVMESNQSKASDSIQQAQKAEKTGVVETLLGVIPKNPLGEMSRVFMPQASGMAIVSVMFFAVVFGVGMTQCAPERVAGLKAVLEGVYDVTMKIIDMAMKLAPWGVAALIFVTSYQMGFSIFHTVFKYMFVVILALVLHFFITYGLILKWGAGRNPVEFFRLIREVLLTAFSTSSSNATLPVALKVAREKLGISRQTGNFVLTIGSTANQNGTALYEGVTVLFLAQFFGLDLTLTQQLGLLLLGVMAGVGTAGVPGGSLPLVVAALVTFGIPAEGIGIILGVDRLLDMCRTVVNVTGDIVLAAWVDAAEKREKTGEA